MKKTFRIIGLALVAVIVTLGFAACGDDPADPESHDKNLVGTWVSEYSDEDYIERTTLEFKSNGSFRMDFLYEDEEETEKAWLKGEWETNNGYVYVYVDITSSSDNMDYPEDEIRSKYKVQGKKLYLDDEEYTRK